MRHATSHLRPASCSKLLQQKPPRISILSLAPATPSSHPSAKILPAALHQRTALAAMSSDEGYNSFLEQANQDTGASAQTSSNSQSASTKAVDTEVPVPLQRVEQYYTSDADEPFEPVSLKWSGENMPSESESFEFDMIVSNILQEGRHSGRNDGVSHSELMAVFYQTNFNLLSDIRPKSPPWAGRSLIPEASTRKC